MLPFTSMIYFAAFDEKDIPHNRNIGLMFYNEM